MNIKLFLENKNTKYQIKRSGGDTFEIYIL